jgi:hypothetical protein
MILFPLSVSHKFIILSLPLTITFPSGEHTMEFTALLLFERVLILFPVSASHIFIVLSVLPLIILLPLIE